MQEGDSVLHVREMGFGIGPMSPKIDENVIK